MKRTTRPSLLQIGKGKALSVEEHKFVMNCLYWENICNLVIKNKMTWTRARGQFHLEHQDAIKAVKESLKNIEGTNPLIDRYRLEKVDGRISSFMDKFTDPAKVNQRVYNKFKKQEREIISRNAWVGGLTTKDIANDCCKNAKNLNDIFLVLGAKFYVYELTNLTYTLQHVGNKKLLKQLFKDPFYCTDAKFEYTNMLRHEEYIDDEAERKSKLHPNLRILQKIGDRFPWICSIMYPYQIHPNILKACPEKKSLPDHCLTVLGDGFPHFRVIVLDPEECTRFRFYEIIDKDNHWFDFSKIKYKVDGSDMHLEDFKKLLEDAIEKHRKKYA